MNHGRCKNCWWWKVTRGCRYELDKNGLTYIKAKGVCYCWSYNVGDKGSEILSDQEEDGYCPDYWNRKKGEKEMGTLDAWIERAAEEFKKKLKR